MTPTDLKRLREAAEKATPGPWTCEDHSGWAYPYVSVADEVRDVIRMRDGRYPDDKSIIGPLWTTRGKLELELANAKYIALANPQAILSLLDAYEKAQERNTDLEGQLQYTAGMLETEVEQHNKAQERIRELQKIAAHVGGDALPPKASYPDAETLNRVLGDPRDTFPPTPPTPEVTRKTAAQRFRDMVESFSEHESDGNMYSKLKSLYCSVTEELERELSVSPMREALEEAEEFIDRHSEPWYISGQELLAKIRAALKAHPSEVRPEVKG